MMSIALHFIVWICIALVMGCAGELMAGRHEFKGFIGAFLCSLSAIILLVGFFHFHFLGELFVANVPLLACVFVAALFAMLWSGSVYQHL